MLTNLICFLIGVIIGAIGIILWTCLVVCSGADDYLESGENDRTMGERK